MKKSMTFFTLFLLTGIITNAQIPNPALSVTGTIGTMPIAIHSTWPDWFVTTLWMLLLLPQSGTDYKMEFIPDQVAPATLISQIQTLQSQGKSNYKHGWATAPISLDNFAERDLHYHNGQYSDTYNFDNRTLILKAVLFQLRWTMCSWC